MKDITNRDLEIGDTIIYPSNGDLELGQVIGFTKQAVKISCRFVKSSIRNYDSFYYIYLVPKAYDINKHNGWKYMGLYKDVIIVDDYPKIDPNKLKSRKQLEWT